MKKQLIFYVLCLIFSSNIQAKIKMPSIFADDMILQQDDSVSLWGQAKRNTIVSIETSWDKNVYKTESLKNGDWRIKIKTPKGGFTPYSITVSDGKEFILNNVLIGEVWLCSGQSNMEMPMKGFKDQPVENSDEEIASSQNNYIRQYKVEQVAAYIPEKDVVGKWSIASPITTSEFSATGYFFAKKLFKELNVPIAILNVSKGGSSILTWMSAESLTQFKGENIQPPTYETTINQERTPTVLFNGMLNSIIGYGIRGVIWYQGEADAGRPYRYINLFEIMISDWRKLWNIGDFPFYYVQIAPFGYGPKTNTAFMREVQIRAMNRISNSGMAIIMDANSPNCIHPAKKKDVGERLSFWALAKTYNKDVMHRSPSMKNYKEKDGKIVIEMRMPNGGKLTSHGKEITELYIAGGDRIFHRATGELIENKIIVSSPDIKYPVAVRYAFFNTSLGQIFCESSGLPISSFRTDDWR